MALPTARVLAAVAALSSVLWMSACVQAQSSESEPWRTSFEAFLQAVGGFPMDDLPFAKVEVGELVGARVSDDAAIMQRFGGRVEFEGVFEGFVTVDDPTSPRTTKEKIDMAMAWPSGLSQNTDWKLHLYSKKSALKSWRALATGTAIRFRAEVTGITMHYPWIPGGHVRVLAILLEDGEIVAKP